MAFDQAMGSTGSQAQTTGSAGWRQFDPGVFTNDAGDYYASEGGQYKYGGKDPAIFGIGKGPSPAAAPAAAPAAPTQGPTSTPAFDPNASGGIVPSGAGAALYKQLSDRANQSLTINPQTDAIIHPQVDAANAQLTRDSNNAINNMAEAGNPYETGALTTAKTQAGEAVGQRTSALQSQLVQNELGARRNEIQGALTQQGQLLTADQQLALQRQLGLLNASMQEQGLTNQNQQYYSGLGQQDKQFLNNLALQYAGLGSQNDQFAANYGLNSTNQASYWDAVRRGLL